MINIFDSITLARTKLRTRRILLTITVVITSLLFASLVFISLVSTGVIKSLTSFGKEGLGERFIVTAQPIVYDPFLGLTPETSKEIQDKHNQLIAQKTALAKKYAIPYDKNSDPDLPLMPGLPNESEEARMANSSSPIVEKIIDQQNLSRPGATFDSFKKIAKANGAIEAFKTTRNNSYQSSGAATNSLLMLKDGQEDLKAMQSQQTGSEPGFNDLLTSWAHQSDDLLKPFLLKGQDFTIGKDGSIPVILPYNIAEKVNGLKKLRSTVSGKQKLDRVVAVRKKSSGKIIPICFRNTESARLLQEALSQQKEIESNKGVKDYTPPSLQHNIPSEPCGAVTVKLDKRTSEEKQQNKAEDELRSISNPQPEAAQGIIKLRIVGISPSLGDAQGSPFMTTMEGALSMLFMSTLGTDIVTPISALSSPGLAQTAQGGPAEERSLSSMSYFAEFDSLEKANQFIKQNDCSSIMNQGMEISNPAPDHYLKLYKKCDEQNRPFASMTFYGNSAGAINDMRKFIWPVLQFVILGIVMLAMVIMMGILGRVVADSRRETAVFRALGAKRLDISQIYFSYILLVGLLISAVALVLGSIAAITMQNIYSKQLSTNAVVVYNSADIHKQFNLFGIDIVQLGIIVILILITALLSAIIPIALSVKRNPINDMRNE